MPPTGKRKKAVRKPKQQRSQATVATIITAGARVLARKGWAGFTTNAVAARAGVSIGSLYEYFGDKQALVDAIADAHIAHGELLVEQARALASGQLSPRDLVDVLVEGAIALHADDPDLHRVLSSDVPLSPQIRQRVARLRAGLVELVLASLRGQVSEPRIAAQLLVDVTDSIVHRWWVEDNGRPGDPHRLAAELKTLLGAYLDRSRQACGAR
ncbi:MAG: TetR/AcrR family transcriptional regulator [Alphaproteobacteria bacterium]